MKHFLVISLFTASVLVLCAGCGSKKKLICGMPIDITTPNDEPMKQPIGFSPQQMVAPIVVYRTRADYSQYVPVTLSNDKTEIVSYPSRFDLGTAPHFAKPIDLGNGFLWDRRGITQQTTFLDITYEQYAALSEDPTPSYLLKHILDAEPFIFIAQCNRHYLPAEITDEALAAYCRQGLPGATILLDKQKEASR